MPPTMLPVIKEVYQIMPKYSEEEFAALKQSIKEKGVLVALEYDEDGNLIDGHHRYRAYRELIAEGHDVPMFDRMVRRYDGDEDAKIEHVLEFNLDRRHLTPEQRRELVFKLRNKPFQWSMPKIAKALHVTAKTVWYDINSLSDEEKAQLASEIVGEDGKVYSTTRVHTVYNNGDQLLRGAMMDLVNKAAENMRVEGFTVQTPAVTPIPGQLVMTTDIKPPPTAVYARPVEERVEEPAEDAERYEKNRLAAFAWYGGKGSHLDWLLPLLPPCQHFVDVFGGSAAVLLNREPSPIETYNDLDGNVVNFFKTLRDKPDELIKSLYLTPFSRSERRMAFQFQLPEGAEADVEAARRFFVMARQTRSGLAQKTRGMLNSWKFTRDAVNRGMSAAVSQWTSGIDDLSAIAARLRTVQIDNYSWDRVIQLYDTPQTLFYCDPPYVTSTRTKDGENAYANELTENDHRNLSEMLHRVKGLVALSGYPSPLYTELYADWHRIDMPAIAHAGARKDVVNDGRNDRIESLWTNYPLNTK